MEATEQTDRSFEMEWGGHTWRYAVGEWFRVQPQPDGTPEYRLIESAASVSILNIVATEDGYL